MSDLNFPKDGQILPNPQFDQAFIDALLKRRSTKILDLDANFGPSASDLEQIIKLAARVPDHGKLAPWRFIVISGEKRAELGQKIAQIAKSLNPNMDDDHFNMEAARFNRGHSVVTLVSKTGENVKVPIWEQELSAGAVGFGLILAAYGFGYTATWFSEWPMFDENVRPIFDLKENERLAGFFYFGKPKTPPIERERPQIDQIIEYWK